MPFLSQKEVLNLKLSCIPLHLLKTLANELKVTTSSSDKSAAIITKVIEKVDQKEIPESKIEQFIKVEYTKLINERRKIISDEDLRNELMKVQTYSWGTVQGQLDQKIQTEYVRKYARYDELLENVSNKLHGEVTNYVICTWFNHWTTVLIEEHISNHPKVVPAIKKVKGIDIFFDRQPFDLKITYLPRGYDPEKAIVNPSELAVWMYENQGEQRFGEHNRLFVILLDKNNPEKSWELKRDFNFVLNKIDSFFNNEKVSEKDEIIFKYKNKTYTTVAKILMITK